MGGSRYRRPLIESIQGALIIIAISVAVATGLGAVVAAVYRSFTAPNECPIIAEESDYASLKNGLIQQVNLMEEKIEKRQEWRDEKIKKSLEKTK